MKGFEWHLTYTIPASFAVLIFLAASTFLAIWFYNRHMKVLMPASKEERMEMGDKKDSVGELSGEGEVVEEEKMVEGMHEAGFAPKVSFKDL